jgi:dTDP-4-amino-4,6-dideoxygalactose transaminase
MLEEIPLSRPDITEHEIDKVVATLRSGRLSIGPMQEQFEQLIAQRTGRRYAIACSSGTVGLHMALLALGIGPGDEVVTTPYTFFATAGSIARVGAKPVFVDIDPVTYNLDPAQIEARVTSKTRAIIPVHLYGQMADMDAVMKIANARGLTVIEDAAQAIGAERDGRRAGSIGHFGCLSFFPSKNLGAAGDGGMVVTNDSRRAEALALLRAHGSKPKYFHKVVGGNFRLDAIQAAVVSAKLPHLDAWTAARQRNAARYTSLFGESGLNVGISSSPREPRNRFQLVLPAISAHRHIFNQYVIRVSERDQLKAALESKGVNTEVYYPVPMHLQECFSGLGYQSGAFPESESAAKETLALPIYPELAEEQARYVVRSVVECLGTVG